MAMRPIGPAVARPVLTSDDKPETGSLATGGSLTLIVKSSVAVWASHDAETVNVVLGLASVGVPLTDPVMASIVRPAGRLGETVKMGVHENPSTVSGGVAVND